jgi:hypothetical protein
MCKKYLINYAEGGYYQSQIENCRTGLQFLNVDECIKYSGNDLDRIFVEKNKKILQRERGNGYWSWKPYIIKKTLDKINDDDLLIYSDSGLSFVDGIDDLIDYMDKDEKKILSFRLEDFHLSKIWTKRDCFYYMGLDYEPFLSNPQILASYMIMRKNKFSVKFVNEWLEYSMDYRCITDDPNTCGLENYSEFRDHRHDQSIFSLLCYKYKILNVRDVSEWGKGEWYSNQKINHHRSRS